MRPPLPTMILSRRAKIIVSVVVALIVLLIVLAKVSGVYINFLWYGQFRHSGVYGTMFWTRVSLFFIFGVLMALIIAGNIFLSYRLRPPFRPMSPEQQNLQHYVLLVEPRRKLLLAAIAVITLLAEGASAQGDWQTWLLWLNGTSFGQKDPQFGRDISFYAWDYPAYRLMLGFGFTAIIVSILLAIAIHYVTGAIRLQTPGPKITLSARRHLTVLVFVFMALKAVAYWLDRYGFVFSSRSKFTGASYADVHAALPAKTILFWITIVLAIGVLASLWVGSSLLPGVGFVVLIVLSILIGGIYPAIVQSVSVNPNASDKEAPYIERNINATRQAYDIVTAGKSGGTVTYKDYAATVDPSPSAITDTNTTIDNIRIMDPNVISPTFTNTQKIGLPYAFSPQLSIDRYTLKTDGKTQTHDYIVAVREQATGSNLSGSQNNWINQHTVYTHGYGFVAAEADTDVTNGAPYTEGGIPPTGPLNNLVPDVYYGQLMNNYSIVGAKGEQREYDANGARTTYAGGGGIPLSNLVTKLAFALKYKETNFILNDAVSAPGAKIIFDRDPSVMVKKLAPFLTVDQDPYPVVDSKTGHIVWMLDGYTTMANFPYSERQSLSNLTGTALLPGQRDTQINYIRNSVKATVDAYTGAVHLYDWDPKDPVLKSWMKVFPGLVQPMSKMPSELESHVRYPQDLFNVQRSLLAQYHITDPVKSYNANGKWAVPSDPFDTAAYQPSYYVLASPPTGGNTAQFQLTTPMLVNNSNNLAAYMSVDSDPGPNYGKITVLQVPGNTTFNGPGQIANDLKSQATISKDITLLSQGQSAVIHGNLLTLPVGDSFLYVEPLYVQSTGTSAFPNLSRVLVRYGDKIGYGETLDAALADIQQGRSPGSSIDESTQSTTPGGNSSSSPSPSSSATPTPSTSTSPSTPSTSTSPSTSPSTPPGTGSNSASIASLRAQLATADQELQQAYDTKNPVTINTAQAKVLQLVNQLVEAGGLAPSK